MKIQLLCYSDLVGGASRAAFRLHKALLRSGRNSELLVAEKQSDAAHVALAVTGRASLLQNLLKALSDRAMASQRSDNSTLHSAAAFFSSGISEVVNSSDADVVNLHWVCGNMLSVEDIGRIRKPILWTMHDMWPFCGAEHYCSDLPDARFEVGYQADNRPTGDAGLDVDRWVWNRKRRSWQRPMHLVAPSRWLGGCASRSLLMRDWPITVIPNPFDTGVFRPHPKLLARETLGLPKDRRLIAFGALAGSVEKRKGFDVLVEALRQLSLGNASFVVFGQAEPTNPPQLGMKIHWTGRLHDDVTLALLYSAVDVMVVPSRQENLPQVATEAQSCGCPVVAFDCTGFPDVVEHRRTGYLAQAYSVPDLAHGIQWILEDDERRAAISRSARQKAVDNWSEEVVVPQYLQAFERAARAC